MQPTKNMIKFNLKAFMLTAILCFPLSLAAQSPLDGTWQTGEDNTLVEVTEQDGVATGKLLSSDNPKAKVGTEILQKFSLADGVWTGSIYAVKRGKVYPATIKPSADTLDITVSAGMMKKKVAWTRATAKK